MTRNLLFATLALLALPLAAGAGTQKPATTRFQVTVENVSTEKTLQLPNGETAPAPTSPVLFVVHQAKAPVFAGGKKDRGMGLESLAEDGDPSALATALADQKGIRTAGAVAIPVGDDAAGPALPGKKFELEFSAAPGDRLTLVMMFGQSNDWFYAPEEAGIALWDAKGQPISGEITGAFELWNAGTEVDEAPGAGANQGPRQKGPNTGPAEDGKVQLVEGYDALQAKNVIRVTIRPDAMATK